MTAATITSLAGRQPATAGLIWEEPPEVTSAGQYGPIAAALHARPGEWAVIRTYDHDHNRSAWSFAYGITGGKYADFRDGFEAKARTIDGQVRIYARYIGLTPKRGHR